MNNEILDRLPPQDLPAESYVLGSVLLEPTCLDRVAAIVRAADFHSDANRAIFEAMITLDRTGAPVDVVSLANSLRVRGDFEKAGGGDHLREVLQSIPHAGHAAYYSKQIVAASQRRHLIHAATDLLRAAYDDGTTAEEAIGQAEEALYAVQVGTADTEPVTMEAAVVDAGAQIDEIRRHGKSLGVPTGFESIDTSIGGCFPGELTLIAARPSRGKSSLAVQIAARMANSGRKVYFATLEVGRTVLAIKRLCADAGVNGRCIRNGTITEADERALAEAASRVASRNFLLHDRAELTVADVARAVRRAKADVAFVDYLQIVTPPDKKANRYEQIGAIATGLKALAMRHRIPVIACAQLGRPRQGQHDSVRPVLSNLRESGNLEQDADAVWLLHRPEVDEGTPPKNVPKDSSGALCDAEINVAKNRNGETGAFLFDWDGPTTTFACHATGGFSEFDEFK